MGTASKLSGGPVAAAARRVPDFVVIGAMRAGTTTLYHHLSGHPQVGMSLMKETDYFVDVMNFKLGYDWYRNQFPSDGRLTGEVSPNYSKHDLFRGVPERLKAASPDAKLIFIARDPVDRFVSHYLFSWHLGYVTVPPEELLDSGNGGHILECSRYARQIETYLKHFPRENLLVLDFNLLKRDPKAALDQVCEFLDIDPMEVGDVATTNNRGELAALPRSIQRIWRWPLMRRFDRFVSRGMRDRLRQVFLFRAKPRPEPEITQELRQRVAAELAEDARAFRTLSGLPFENWSV